MLFRPQGLLGTRATSRRSEVHPGERLDPSVPPGARRAGHLARRSGATSGSRGTSTGGCRLGSGSIAQHGCASVPWSAWLALFVAASSLLPVFSSSGYVRRVGFDTVLYMLLALGLNVVVGWGGLLDLGYVAFYGVGAYSYALLDSDHYGDPHVVRRLAAVVMIIGAIVGLLVGLPSRRLSGDYLAIVTLFFLQLFQTLMVNGDQVFGHNVTGGANGLAASRPARPVRPRPGGPARGRLRGLVLLRRPRLLRRRLRRAAVRERIAHRARMAARSARTRSRPS